LLSLTDITIIEQNKNLSPSQHGYGFFVRNTYH